VDIACYQQRYVPCSDTGTGLLLRAYFSGFLTTDVPDICFQLVGYLAIFTNPVPVPAKTVPGTGYLSRIVLGPFWQLVELSEWAPYCKTVGLMSHVDQLFYIY